VANPPYGAKWQGGKKSPFREDPRFKDLPVMPPSNFADWAFIAHIASCLSQNGRAVLLDMAGSLFRSSEKLIRFHFLKQGLIKAVVHLPGGLFANTQIPVELILLEKTPMDRSVYFLDASQILEEGKEPTKEQIDKIASMVLNRREEKYVSKIVYFDGLNGFDPDNYTLTPSWYIDKKPAEKSPYEGMKLEDIIKEARKERQERDKKMTEIEDELLRLVGDLKIE
jgi:type I restriction enzyme M protein